MSKKDLDRARDIDARALELQRKFSHDRFLVIRKELFAHLKDPALTIRPDGITFNQACISKLENVVYIRLLVNDIDKQVAIEECDENYRNALRWCVVKPDGSRKSRKITCKEDGFSQMVYEMMGWDSSKRYKMLGFLIEDKEDNNKPVFIFDLTMTENFPLKRESKKTAVEKNTVAEETAISVDNTESSDKVAGGESKFGETMNEEKERQGLIKVRRFSEIM